MADGITMTEEFRPILNFTDLSANYADAGDTILLTTGWTARGEGGFMPPLTISADFVYDKAQRFPENMSGSFSVALRSYPPVSLWKDGMSVSVSGSFTLPSGFWSGPYRINIRINDAAGRSVPFAGADEKTVFCQDIGQLDLGWGWGRKKLLEQRRPVHAEFNTALHVPPDVCDNPFLVGFLPLNQMSPTAPGPAFPPIFTVYNSKSRSTSDHSARTKCVSLSPGRAIYTVSGGGATADVIFERNGDDVLISITNTVCENGLSLSSVYIPRLLSFNEDGELYNFFGGGRLVEIKDSLPFGAEFLYDSNCAVGGSDRKGAFAVTADDMDSSLTQSVEIVNGEKHGCIGCRITLLLPAFGGEARPIPVKQIPLRVTNISPGWQSFAGYLRSRLPAGRMSRYPGTVFYKISVDKKYEADERRPFTISRPVDFAGVRSIIERIYNITDGIRQVVYLAGWQRNGHDTEYPFPQKHGFSPALGDPAEWQLTLDFAEKHNAVLSFHDNFDDAYVTEGLISDAVALDRNGKRRTGWLWAGGMSHIISPKAYCETGLMAERVKETLKTYGIKTSYHLDVLSAEIRRYDYSSKYLSAAAENVFYKKKICEEFADYGVDVTSEMLSEPFVGILEYVLHTKIDEDARLFPLEEYIPLTPFVYHGRIRYSRGSLDKKSRASAVDAGSVCGLDCLGISFGDELVKSLYLHAIPMLMLAEREILSHKEFGGISVADYAGGRTEVERKTGHYRIEVDGETVTRNGITVAPHHTEAGTWLAFSEKDAEISLPIGGEAEITELSFDGSGKSVHVSSKHGHLSIKLKACVPVKVSLCS